MFYLRFFFLNSKKMSESLIFAYFLFFGQRCEWIAHFPQIKWAMWVNCSFRSPKMSDHEWFAQVDQRKWAMWANRSFCLPKMSKWENRSFFLSESLMCSFLDKKQAICLEIKWANSQPCTSAGQNTTLSLPTDVFSYWNSFDNCLIMKNWNPK